MEGSESAHRRVVRSPCALAAQIQEPHPLAGDFNGTRLNRVYASNVPIAEIPALLRPTLEAYRDERKRPEGFGDWVERTGLDALRRRFTSSGAAS